MVDSTENILVEFDYQNISIIDPNKVVDEDGKAKERLIKQEDLVYYANLECSVLPRTKLAIGVPLEDSVRTISVGKINFLNPGNNKFLEEIYVDEITGKGSLEGKGINQQKINAISNPNQSDDYFYRQTTMTKGKIGATDTGMLGMKQININYGTDFLPVIDVTLEDVKGRALFEAGANSPYAAFFQLPYPLFYLTIKGYLGKAVRLPLMLQSFNASFEPSSHNFRVQLKFYTYKYTIMSHISWQAMMAAPLMFQSQIETTSQTTTGEGTKNQVVQNGWSSRGYSKMKELYAEYKSKGLIDDNFPEITIQELQVNLNSFLKNIIDNYPKTNIDTLVSMEQYLKTLDFYEQEVLLYEGNNSWFNKYMDTSNPFYTFPANGESEGILVYQFKKEYSTEQQRNTALTELSKTVVGKNNILNNNSVFGNGKPNNIPVDIFLNLNNKTGTFYYNGTIQTIDPAKTYYQRNKKDIPFSAETTFKNFIASQYDASPKFFFKGSNSFQEKITTIRENYQTKSQEIEQKLSEELVLNISKSASEGGIGFSPTIRNVLAVFLAQGESFLRLLDEVHTKAWDLREDTLRKAVVLSTSSGANSVDLKNDLSVFETPIYPWPQIIVENNLKEGERYELKYPGDLSIAAKIRAYQPEIWPEVEFVEDFIKAIYERKVPDKFPTDTTNTLLKPNRLSFNAIEFPITNQVYQNVEEVKFFYEIYERLLLNSFYSKLSRDSNKIFNMTEHYAESEVLSMIKSLGNDNPFLTKKLKEYDINSNIYLSFLRHISNGGSGESWQNFIRGIFNTGYINNEVENSFRFINQDIFANQKSQPLLSVTNEKYPQEYFGSSNIVENFDFTDVYPITNLNWINNYMADGNNLQKRENVFKTNQVLEYNTTIKSISNFDNNVESKDKQPVTNFNYKTNNSGTFKQSLDLTNLQNFYENRKILEQYTTEGNIEYFDYNNNLTPNQTTSMLNTPYFINAIQEGVFKFRFTNDLYPYKNAAYLFLNSLPLATLREKYKEDNNGSFNDLDYIFSTFKKYGAIHRLPYAWILKYGSIWHRYKKWLEDEEDILDSVWTDFNYLDNYDPQLSALTKTFSLVLNSVPQDIVLQQTFTNGSDEQDVINVGFYPKLLDDFNTFIQGRRVFETLVPISGTCTISGSVLTVTAVSGNDLFDGAIISGPGISFATTITGQTSGTIGGIGEYLVDIPQSIDSPVNFVVGNPPNQFYSDDEVQLAINNGVLFMKNSPLSTIIKPNGFDSTNPNRSLTLKPWSCYVSSPDGANIYPMPSFGSNVNQTNFECFRNDGTLRTEVENNPAMFNGSVRLFWKAPNYGYFDNNKLTKPNPDSYMKKVFNKQSVQENFSINQTSTEYSKISEIFTTFEKDILDLMETEFLNFSKSFYDFTSNIKPTIVGDTTQTNTTNGNFQSLMRQMMKIPKPQNTDNSTVVITEIQEAQVKNFEQYLNQFMEYKVSMVYGNPSNFDRQLFYSYSNQVFFDPISFQGYNSGSPNSLPFAGGSITLAQSQTQNPETWKALKTYVGFSEIPQLVYSDNGSYITDFFLDMNIEFTENSIKTLSPLIKIYATQKLENPNLDSNTFRELIDDYIVKNNTYINTLLDLELTRLRKELPSVNVIQSDTKVRAKLEGEQTRYELYDLFKSMNDTWISGTDFKSKTLFEDILLMDRASRDIGQQIYVDVFKLKELIDNANSNLNLLDIVQTVLVENNFVNFIVPAFANFYNVRDVGKNLTPRTEGSLEFANTLFGTFLNVDYRETASKFVCLYGNVDSQYLAMNDNVDYRYRDDAFDLRRATDNPLLENQENKTDWSTSNKVVGFNVDIGPQNQQIFKQLDISQDPGKPTTESLEVLNQMANLDRNRGSYSQSVSLYNLYKNRSYKCSVDMMGNALIQPMMYFNLRNVPLFSGPYMITKIEHRISENGFDTTFEGQRQPFYSIPKIDSFIQSISTTILQKIKEQIKQKDNELKAESLNVLTQMANKMDDISKVTNVATQSISCAVNMNPSYIDLFTYWDTPEKNTINNKDAVNLILKLVKESVSDGENQKILGTFIYGIMKVTTKGEDELVTFGNNYGLITLNLNYGDSITYFSPKYFCTAKNVPFAVFPTIDSFINFMIAKYGTQIELFKQYAAKEGKNVQDSVKYGKAFAKFYMNNYPTTENSNLFDILIEDKKNQLEKLFEKSYVDFVAMNRFNISPSEETPPRPIDYNFNWTSNNLNNVEINFYPDQGNWNLDKVEIMFTQKPVECTGVTNTFINVSTFISPNKQVFFMDNTNLLSAIGCPSVNGQYSISFTVKAIPVLDDGITTDTTRPQVTQTISISPKL